MSHKLSIYFSIPIDVAEASIVYGVHYDHASSKWVFNNYRYDIIYDAVAYAAKCSGDRPFDLIKSQFLEGIN